VVAGQSKLENAAWEAAENFKQACGREKTDMPDTLAV